MTKKCFITVNDEVWCFITGLQPSEIKALSDAFALYVDGYFFQPKYKLGTWDGKVRFFHATGKTYLRLLDKILPFLEKWGYDVELVDKRAAVVGAQSPGSITEYDNSAIAISAEGLNLFGEGVEVSGKPFKLRPYQLECIKLCAEVGSGFVIAGTGAGKCVSGCTTINIKCSSELKEAIQHVRRNNLSRIQDRK